jgi:hypothetical protein
MNPLAHFLRELSLCPDFEIKARNETGHIEIRANGGGYFCDLLNEETIYNALVHLTAHKMYRENWPK